MLNKGRKNTGFPESKKDTSIGKSELLFIEYVVFIGVVLTLLPMIRSGSGDDIWLWINVGGVVVYLSSVFLIRKIYLYTDHLIVYYPARFIFRKREIKYSDIRKIRYIHSNSAYAVPEVRIYRKGSSLPLIYASLSYKRRKEILKTLHKAGVTVEIDSEYQKDQDILKED